MNPVRAFDYLMLAREKLFDWIRPLSQSQYTQEFPFGLRTLRATMLEIAGAEWIYAHRLRGDPVPPRPERPVSAERLPTFDDLERFWRPLALQTRALLASIEDWGRPMPYRWDEHTVVSPTRGDIATQLCFHEVHHRAQAMAMLRQLDVAAQDVDFSFLMYPRRAEPI